MSSAHMNFDPSPAPSAQVKLDHQKLKELVVYICAQNDGNEKFGMVKLNKLLFFSDFAAYARTGRPITGAKYKRLPFGPCPDELATAVDELKRESRIFSQKLTVGAREATRLKAVFDADLTLFSAEEISIADEMIRRFWGHNATEISDVSHLFAGWELLSTGDDIPYWTAMIPDRPLAPSVALMEEAKRRAARLSG